MKLPNAAKAVVDRDKIEGYLLNPSHPDNGGKAQFFEGLGFHRSEWVVLAGAFKSLAGKAATAQSITSTHGKKYVIIGKIESPCGKSPKVKTIWIVDSGSDMARLITAYPQNE
jgi:hypothetical protein